jgi:hypothetical protein
MCWYVGCVWSRVCIAGNLVLRLGCSPTEATRLRFDKKITLQSPAYWSNLQFAMALLPPARPRCDDDLPWIKCSRLFSWSNRSRVALVGERPKQQYAHCLQIRLHLCGSERWIWKFFIRGIPVKVLEIQSNYSFPNIWLVMINTLKTISDFSYRIDLFFLLFEMFATRSE